MSRAFRLRSGKQGIALRLHELESEVMDVVWARALDRFAVSDVLDVLERRREIAYTTVMTTLSRLHEKGVLTRHRDGKRYLYSPAVSREEFLQDTARTVLEQLGPVAESESMALLVEAVSSSDCDALDELERLIRARRKELKS
jgi:predicted transcriptional regulator